MGTGHARQWGKLRGTWVQGGWEERAAHWVQQHPAGANWVQQSSQKKAMLQYMVQGGTWRGQDDANGPRYAAARQGWRLRRAAACCCLSCCCVRLRSALLRASKAACMAACSK